MFILLFVACNQEIQVTPSQDGCTNFDYNNPADPVVDWVAQGDGALVSHQNVLLPESGLSFKPELVIDRGVLSVHEYWEDPANEEPFCYVANVLVQGYAGELEVRWYEGDDVEPLNTFLISQ